jgi:ribosomal protein S18 acetylase RimI-like enzyme
MNSLEIQEGSQFKEKVVEHYLAIWDSYGTPPDHYRMDARASVLRFIAEEAEGGGLGLFVAFVGEVVAGSLACGPMRCPYPEVVAEPYRKFGYIWSVYTEPWARGQGVAIALVEKALVHLHALGCTMAVLNSSEPGRPLYLKAGFSPASEMRKAL